MYKIISGIVVNSMVVSAFNGIIKYEKNTGKKTYLDRASANLADSNVLSLHLDSLKNVWYGCQYNGVGKLRHS